MNCSEVVESQMKLLFHSNKRSKAVAMNTWILNIHWLKCTKKSNMKVCLHKTCEIVIFNCCICDNNIDKKQE